MVGEYEEVSYLMASGKEGERERRKKPRQRGRGGRDREIEKGRRE